MPKYALDETKNEENGWYNAQFDSYRNPSLSNNKIVHEGISRPIFAFCRNLNERAQLTTNRFTSLHSKGLWGELLFTCSWEGASDISHQRTGFSGF